MSSNLLDPALEDLNIIADIFASEPESTGGILQYDFNTISNAVLALFFIVALGLFLWIKRKDKKMKERME